MQMFSPLVFFMNFSESYIYTLFQASYRSMSKKKKRTNVMAELHEAESIYRSLLLHRENPCISGADSTIRLRHTLAKDGCKESQITLAKYLLTVVSNCPAERDFNAQSAIYWLLQAVKTGQEEAFLLLEECFKTGVGINAVNCSEIEKCLRFSKEEKFARKIAFSIYRAIMSDTEELIPSDIFGDKIELIFQRKNPENLCDESKDNSSQMISETLCQTKIEESSQDQKCVSFSEVVSSVQTCLEGNVPLVSLKQVINYSEYKSWLSTKYLHIVWDLIMKSLENLIFNLSSLRLSALIILMIILSFFSVFLVPGNIVCQEIHIWLKSSLCLVIMLSCTCFVININFGGNNLKRWLHLIKYFEPNIKSQEIREKYSLKTTYPLLTFFFASFFYIAFLPSNPISATFTDIGFLCFFLMVLMDRTIDQKRYYVNISLILNVLTCLYKANIIQSSFNNIGSYLNFQFDYTIANNLYLHISFISCLALPFVLPYLYFKMGKESRSVLLPHLMSLTWMNLACIHLSNTMSSQQIFSVFSWLAILLLSNYTGFLFTLILYCFLIIFRTQDYFKVELFIFGLIFVFMYFLSFIIIKKLKISHESKIWSFIVCSVILASSFQALRPQTPNVGTIDTAIPWEKYQSYCHHNAWYRTNTAEVQISCLPLKGRDVTLEGTVTSIDLIEVHNNLQIFANILPEPLHSWFVCALGENYVLCNSSEKTSLQGEHCKMYKSLNVSQCHLHNLDTYLYQITVEISSRTSPEVFLITDHACTPFVKTLKEGDALEVVGRLDFNVGGTKPVLTLKKARCTSCYTNRDCNISSMQPVPSHLKFSWKNLVWFYFAPLIRYNTD
ncbi:wolframin [Parasteatoda tepidariorum]|uniref:wolframin n=1 Tax=Parasteatoda tepidariorum TaxID=114398 RepID=UPI00077FB4F1|nr:wolframin-like [Parasteatoda tepidariorum]